MPEHLREHEQRVARGSERQRGAASNVIPGFSSACACLPLSQASLPRIEEAQAHSCVALPFPLCMLHHALLAMCAFLALCAPVECSAQGPEPPGRDGLAPLSDLAPSLTLGRARVHTTDWRLLLCLCVHACLFVYADQ
eukprot:m.239372 g.239372  ORF g.239372 m.239372 type:complete len:138 (-) comp54370_c0_seq3:17-430(-)